MLHPDFPTVEGEYEMSKHWSVTLPGRFNRRFEDRFLIIWRPRLTVYVVVWNNDNNESKDRRLARIKQGISNKAFDLQEGRDHAIFRFSYRLEENRDEGVVHALYAYAIGQNGHVQAAIYFDDESDADVARTICRSFAER